MTTNFAIAAATLAGALLGVPYPAAAQPAATQPVLALMGHAESVEDVAFSPDGRRILSASADGTARIWNATTGAQIAVLQGHTDAVRSAVFAPDGTRILTASLDGTVRIWDAVTLMPVRVLNSGILSGLNGAAFSPDGRRIAAGGIDGAVVFDAATGMVVYRFSAQYFVNAVSFSPDGGRIATTTGNESSIQIWDAATGAPLQALAMADAYSRSYGLAYSADGQRLAMVLANGTTTVWNALTGAKLWERSPVANVSGSQGMRAVAFSPDGRYLVTGTNENILVYDAATGAELAVLTGPRDNINSIIFSADGTRLVTGYDSGAIAVWNAPR